MIQQDEIKRLFDMEKDNHYYPFNLRGHKLPVIDSNISDIAKLLINYYGGSLSKILNTGLRRTPIKKLDDIFTFYDYLLKKALMELPPYSKESIVFRMDRPSHPFKDIKHWFNENTGKTICFPNFLSTSKDKWERGVNDIIFKINTSSYSRGRDISFLTGKPLEREVLFMSRSKFKVGKINQRDKTIYLDEVNNCHLPCIIIYENTYMNDLERMGKIQLKETLESELSLTERGLI